MQIEITGNSIGEATIDLNRFKTILSKTLNLEMAVRESVKINKIREIHTEQFLRLIWLMIDWGKIINKFKDIDEETMEVKAYAVKYKDWPMFSPGVTDGRKFDIIIEEKSGVDIILTQSFMKDVSWNIGNFIENSQFKYGHPPKEWGVAFVKLSDSSYKDLNKRTDNNNKSNGK